MPVAMSEQRFAELVEDALDLLPEQFASAMNNVVVLIEERNPDDDSILGLYEGIALPDRDSNYVGQLPDRILIYRDALLQACASEQDVVDEVATTVVHEIAHHFGIDDERLHQLGWA